MKRVFFFVLFFAFSISSFSQNLVLNPGFETWSRIDKPGSWTNTQGCLKDSVFILSGTYSCRQEGISISRDLGQKIEISSGKQYSLSFFYKTGTILSGNGCRVWCEWLDENKNGIDDPESAPFLHSSFLKSDEWKQFSVDIMAPANARYFYLLVRTLPNSITYWDDIVFEENVETDLPEKIKEEVKIYPNPAHNYLTISNLHNLQHIDIQDITGNSVWSSDFHKEETITIPVTQWADGLYFLCIKTSETTLIRKFIKR